jgi:hypothetical protein
MMKENGGIQHELTAAGETNAEEGSSAKKSYMKPALTIYGTIRDLTKMVGLNGPLDGGTGNMSNSHV